MARTKKSKPGSASKKRKRPSQDPTNPVDGQAPLKKAEIDDDLKNLLTGVTENVNDATPKSVPDATVPVKKPSTEESQTVAQNGDTNNGEEASVVSKEATVSPWMIPLREAHADKVSVTVILDRANLETTKASGRAKNSGLTLLNCDDHRMTLQRTNRDANDARPDITHQCLLALQDSPLNKAGKLKVYVRTAKNVLIDIHPQTRIPRTYKRFAGLMTELLDKLKIRGTSGSMPLLKVIRNPVTAHLPVGARKIVCTYNSENVVDMRDHAMKIAALAIPENLRQRTNASNASSMEIDELVKENGEKVNAVYVIGAMAHGKIIQDWADEYICISEYPLSAATVCSRLLYSYESLLGIM